MSVGLLFGSIILATLLSLPTAVSGETYSSESIVTKEFNLTRTGDNVWRCEGYGITFDLYGSEGWAVDMAKQHLEDVGYENIKIKVWY